MNKNIKWIIAILIVAAVFYIRFGTDLIHKQYLEEAENFSELTVDATMDKDGKVSGSAFLESGGTLKRPLEFSVSGKLDKSGKTERVNGGLIKTSSYHFGFWSLLPALVTIVLAFTTRQVLLSLFTGIFVGGIVAGNVDIVTTFLLPAIGSGTYAQILLIYLWCLGGLIGLWSKTGGAEAFANWAAKAMVKSPKTAKLFAYFMGLVFHQGGTISTVLAGTTVKPIADAERVSHEELAYIIDSTASPVATIIPLNAWPAITGALIVGTTATLTTQDAALSLFLHSIPFNFYAIIALIFTFLTAMEWMPWYGKRMKTAIKRARETGELDSPTAEPMTAKELTTVDVAPGYKSHPVDFIFPLLVLIFVAGMPLLLIGKIWVDQAFFSAVVVGMLLAMYRGMPMKTAIEAFVSGVKGVTIGAIILAFAITLGYVSTSLGTAHYLISTLGGLIPPIILPALFLLLCMIISFSTGSSFGTFAVVLPLAMPLAGSMSESLGNPELFMVLSFGALLGGAVFGDNCSPISDTTILSSVATGCDLMDHVYTQLPMAALASGLAAIIYTVIAYFAL
jgi:Na+/H+ antiporter NhaC